MRITDFGLAKLAEDPTDGEIAGTPAYMAPEQLSRGETTIQSDLYSLGLILYELFTGEAVYQPGSVQELSRVHEESSPSQPSTLVDDMDPDIERVILRCLETQPNERPKSAHAVAAALPGGDPLAAVLAAGETPLTRNGGCRGGDNRAASRGGNCHAERSRRLSIHHLLVGRENRMSSIKPSCSNRQCWSTKRRSSCEKTSVTLTRRSIPRSMRSMTS